MNTLPLKNSKVDPILEGFEPTLAEVFNAVNPLDKTELSEIYILWFRRGTSPFPEMKFFSFKGTLKQAMDRGRQHCDNITARFLRVDPFLHDLTEDEVKHRKSE